MSRSPGGATVDAAAAHARSCSRPPTRRWTRRAPRLGRSTGCGTAMFWTAALVVSSLVVGGSPAGPRSARRGRARSAVSAGDARTRCGVAVDAGPRGVTVVTLLVFLVLRRLGRPRHRDGARPRSPVTIRSPGTSGGGRCSTPTPCRSSGCTTANEIHVPVGQPVVVELRSPTSSTASGSRTCSGKQDLIPGRREQRLVPGGHARASTADQCAEFCGHQHAKMAFLADRRAAGPLRAVAGGAARDAARTPADSVASRGQEVFLVLAPA